MNNELKIKIGSEERKIFLQDGFYKNILPGGNLHKHKYTEIHVMCGGSGEIIVDGKRYDVTSDSVIAIPRGALHSCAMKSEGGYHRAFQIDALIEKLFISNIDNGISCGFFSEIEKSEKTEDCSLLCAYISLICSHIKVFSPISAHRIVDYGFLIFEFFSRNYGADVRLSDLAHVLYLSERQTERLVLEHTGKTFSAELTATRMIMAKELIAKTSMSVSEISKYVGYSSYSGFWKAMKRYNAENERKE